MYNKLYKFRYYAQTKIFINTVRTVISSVQPEILRTSLNKTLAEHIFQSCDKFPNNTAYINDETSESYKYSDVKTCVNAIASALVKRNITVGTMSGIVADNSPEYLMILYALNGMGCPVTLCNQNYTLYEMTYQFNDSRPAILFTDLAHLEKVKGVAASVSSVKKIFVIDSVNDVDNHETVKTFMQDSGDASPIGSLDIDVDNDIALMPYSSGTTGLPKGVILTNTNKVMNTEQIRLGHYIDEQHVLLMSLPLYHIYATIIIPAMAIYQGSTIVIQPKFNPKKYLQAIQKYKVSLLHLVPPQVLFFLNYPEVSNTDISTVKLSYSAAAPLDKVTEIKFVDLFRKYQPTFDLYQCYGLTETSPISHMYPPKDVNQEKRYGSVGRLVSNMSCKVVDASTREEVGVGVKGEILLKGPNILKGYFGKSGSTQEAFEKNWFKTGDIGMYDEDGYFYVTDRFKELIKVKGYQVAPAEIEGVLLSHSNIVDCAVVGVPHERFGEAAKAFIVRNSSITESEVYKYMEERLSPYKQLHGGIEFIDEIPKSPSGKILRRLLKVK